MAIWHSGSFPDLRIVCTKKWSGVVICQSLKSGRRTCSRIIRASERSQKNSSREVPVRYRPLKKQTAASSEKSSVETVVAYLRILWAPSYLQLLRVLQLGKDWAVFVLGSSLEVTLFRISTPLGNCGMGRLNSAGLRGQKLDLQRLNSTLSSASSFRWKRVAIGLVCKSIASLHSASSLVSILGGIYTKLVFWCFEIISKFSWFNTCVAFRSFNWQH